jgi:hypothetical protein
MSTMSAAQLKLLMVRTRQRYREIDHADWDAAQSRHRTHEQHKWVQAAKETAPADWVECVRILGYGWDYYLGSCLPGEESA